MDANRALHTLRRAYREVNWHVPLASSIGRPDFEGAIDMYNLRPQHIWYVSS
jgi:hypothetical protein